MSGSPSNSGTAFVVAVDQVTEADWNILLPQFDDANIYQTWAYGAVCWGEKQLSHLVLKCGGKALAAAQLRLVKLPLIRAGVAYLRWGPLWRIKGNGPDPLVLTEMTQAVRREYVERRGLVLRLLPNVFQGDTLAAEVALSCRQQGLELQTEVRPYHTSRVAVAQPLDELRKGLQSRWRNYLKAAAKDDFTLIQGSGDELYDQFTVLYREMMMRKQFETTVSVEEFRQIHKRLPQSQKLQVFVCSKDGQPWNALVVSALGDTGIFLLAATGNAGLNGRGAHLLQWRAMEWLHQQGVRWYDTGGINPEKNPGGYQFKSGLGGQEVTALGRFELRGNRLSNVAVNAAERLKALVARIKK